MKSYIKAIILFKENGDKRVVPLKQGVNIITGESKTGKSALVEIIDYCLCSSQCTVPKGIITQFAALYALIINIDDVDYVIARPKAAQKSRMYFIKESAGIEADQLSFDYFNPSMQIGTKEAQSKIEAALGLSVSNTASDLSQKQQKASLRNMVSYLFQHQNLMASKFALFYRFNDYQKRLDTIQQFPIFAGILDQTYYSNLIELNELKSKLRKAKREAKSNQTGHQYISQKIRPLAQNYYALLGEPYDDSITAKPIGDLPSILPLYDNSRLFQNMQLAQRYSQLETELEQLRSKEGELLLRKNNLIRTTSAGNGYKNVLNNLRSQANSFPPQDTIYHCPLCGHRCDEIQQKDQEIHEAMDWINQELQITHKYTSGFSEDLRKIEDELNLLNEKIGGIWHQLKEIEDKYISSKTLVSHRNKAAFAKAEISVYADLYKCGVFPDADTDISQLEGEISRYEEIISTFDVESKMAEAQVFLSKNMNRLALGLDFEEEFRPINLRFSLSNQQFELYQYRETNHSPEKIHLYEMGSGANWVSCHIALFLSFLRYFSTQPNSTMPLFLFFDQPSQVYFPHGEDSVGTTSESDIVAVNNMYTTIFNEINSIGNDTGTLPQIIIVDHVNGDGLKCRDEFKSYIRCDWRNGKALI